MATRKSTMKVEYWMAWIDVVNYNLFHFRLNLVWFVLTLHITMYIVRTVQVHHIESMHARITSYRSYSECMSNIRKLYALSLVSL